MFYRIVIPDAAGESTAMDEGSLDEQMAPEEDIGTGIDANAIPFSDKT